MSIDTLLKAAEFLEWKDRGKLDYYCIFKIETSDILVSNCNMLRKYRTCIRYLLIVHAQSTTVTNAKISFTLYIAGRHM